MLQVVYFKRLRLLLPILKVSKVSLFPAVEKSLGLAAVSFLERRDGAHSCWSPGQLVSIFLDLLFKRYGLWFSNMTICFTARRENHFCQSHCFREVQWGKKSLQQCFFVIKDWSQDMIPTVGFNMRKITKGRVTIKLWDIGGQPRWYCAHNVSKVIDFKVQVSVNVGTVLQRRQCHSLHGGQCWPAEDWGVWL